MSDKKARINTLSDLAKLLSESGGAVRKESPRHPAPLEHEKHQVHHAPPSESSPSASARKAENAVQPEALQSEPSPDGVKTQHDASAALEQEQDRLTAGEQRVAQDELLVHNRQAELERQRHLITQRRQELSRVRQAIGEKVAADRATLEDIQVLVDRLGNLDDAGKTIAEVANALDLVDARQQKLDALIETNRKFADEIKNQKAELEVQLERSDKLSERRRITAKKLRSTVKENIIHLEALEKQQRSLTRQNSKLTKQVAQYADLHDRYEFAEHALSWALAHGGKDDRDVLRPTVVVVGEGPVSAVEFDRFLRAKGIKVSKPGSRGVPYMIVGRSDWSELEIEMQIAVQQGAQLKVYSQEMALLAFAAGSDPFEEASNEEMMVLAGDHPALDFLQNGELRWPLSFVEALPKEFTPFALEEGGVEASPLKSLGYTVGRVKGLPKTQRDKILANAFLGQLPFVHSDEYMRDWGTPQTRRRLWRIAHHLAWLANSWKKVPNHRYAVNDWVTDLGSLKKNYFKPWMGFAWPKVKVPGGKRRR